MKTEILENRLLKIENILFTIQSNLENNINTQKPLYLDFKDTCKTFSFKPTFLNECRKDGIITPVKIKGKLYFSVLEIEKLFIENRQ